MITNKLIEKHSTAQNGKRVIESDKLDAILEIHKVEVLKDKATDEFLRRTLSKSQPDEVPLKREIFYDNQIQHLIKKYGL